MSQAMRVHLKCDRHQVEDDGVRTRIIAIDGQEWEIEGCTKEEKALISPLLEWLEEHGRKQPKVKPKKVAAAKKATAGQSVATRTGKPSTEVQPKSSKKAAKKTAEQSSNTRDQGKYPCPICDKPYGKYYLNEHCSRSHHMTLRQAQEKTGKVIVGNRGRQPTVQASKNRNKRGATRRKAA